MSNLSQFVTGIKSIQRGTTTGGAITVTAVNMAKSQVNFLGCSVNAGTGAPIGRISLTTTTNLQATLSQDGNGGNPGTLSWELIEGW